MFKCWNDEHPFVYLCISVSDRCLQVRCTAGPMTAWNPFDPLLGDMQLTIRDYGLYHQNHCSEFPRRRTFLWGREIISLVKLKLTGQSQNCSPGQLNGAHWKAQGGSKKEACIMYPHTFSSNRKHASLPCGSSDLSDSQMPGLWKWVITFYFVHFKLIWPRLLQFASLDSKSCLFAAPSDI